MKRIALLAAFALVIAMPATAQAQCSYRMNDVGRPHGYLSGPCNGAAQNYAGAYRSRAATSSGVTRWCGRNGEPQHTNVRNSDGSISSPANGLRTVKNGNTARTYDSSGRLISYGIRHGNVLKSYDSKGRLTGRGVFGPNGATLYDARGRFVSSTPDVR
jgi:hypothetical protein